MKLLKAVCAGVAMLAFLPGANAAAGSEDRLALMASGTTLTNTNGGWGASALWLHNFNPDTILGIGGEHQTIGDARWNFGRLSLNHGFGEAQSRTNLYAEAQVGSGRDLVHSYDYDIFTAGLYQSFSRQFTLQLEDKQIDVDTAKGNLPKLAVSYLWSPLFQTSVGYTHSVSGTLGTRLALARVDTFTKTLNLFAGFATGQAAPIAINLPPSERPSVVTHEYYLGAGRDFSRADTKLVLDYSRLTGSDHWTLTFNAMLHKRTGAAR